MNTKLTLRFSGQVIENAKRFAASENRSVSSLVEDYFRRVAATSPAPTTKRIANKSKTKVVAKTDAKASQPLPPSTQSLVGILAVTSDDDKRKYRAHLEAKHL